MTDILHIPHCPSARSTLSLRVLASLARWCRRAANSLATLAAGAACCASLHAGNTFMRQMPDTTNSPGDTVSLWVRLFYTQRYDEPKPLANATVYFTASGELDINGERPMFPDQPAWRPVVTDSDGFARTTYYISPTETSRAIGWRAEFPGDGNFSRMLAAGTITIRHPATAAPSNLQAVELASDHVLLRWQDNSSNESGFRVIRRGPGDPGPSEVGSLGRNVATFTDRNVKPETTYNYSVQAFGVGGESSWIPIRVTTPPVAPARVTLREPADNANGLALPVKLVWNTVSRAALYRIEVSESDPSNVKIRATKTAQDTAVGTYTTSALVRGRTYYWRVCATDRTGQSGSWSVWRHFTVRK